MDRRDRSGDANGCVDEGENVEVVRYGASESNERSKLSSSSDESSAERSSSARSLDDFRTSLYDICNEGRLSFHTIGTAWINPPAHPIVLAALPELGNATGGRCQDALDGLGRAGVVAPAAGHAEERALGQKITPDANLPREGLERRLEVDVALGARLGAGLGLGHLERGRWRRRERRDATRTHEEA